MHADFLASYSGVAMVTVAPQSDAFVPFPHPNVTFVPNVMMAPALAQALFVS